MFQKKFTINQNKMIGTLEGLGGLEIRKKRFVNWT